MAKKSKNTSNGFIQFVEPGAGAPATLLAEVEVPITEGALGGLKVTGIRVWRRKAEPDHIFVTFPGRQYETGNGETKTYEYLRASDGQGVTVKAMREQILAAYHEHRKGVGTSQQ